MMSAAWWLPDLQLLRTSGTARFEMTDDLHFDMKYDFLFDIK